MKHTLIAAVLVGLPIAVLAQPATPDTLTALLQEVRALRVALERSAITGPQIQLLAGRLTVQNERVSRAARDLDQVRLNLSNTSMATARAATQAQQLEQTLATTANAEQRKQIEFEQRVLKQQIEEMTAEEQRLRLRETELAAALAAEQTAWNELNRRLDELERILKR
jgi:chromosome segregation ATPase